MICSDGKIETLIRWRRSLSLLYFWCKLEFGVWGGGGGGGGSGGGGGY